MLSSQMSCPIIENSSPRVKKSLAYLPWVAGRDGALREEDSLVEGDGFEPSVPRQQDLCKTEIAADREHRGRLDS